jgi:ATP-dependent RNA helicase DDX23/PRP28
LEKLKKKSKILNKYNNLGTSLKYTEKEEEDMNERDWRIFREDYDIQIMQGTGVNPIRNWKESKISKDIKDNIKRMGFKKPTPIQMQSINVGIHRRDMVGLAPTGSGKSAAFLIPMIHYLSLIDRDMYDAS